MKFPSGAILQNDTNCVFLSLSSVVSVVSVCVFVHASACGCVKRCEIVFNYLFLKDNKTPF